MKNVWIYNKGSTDKSTKMLLCSVPYAEAATGCVP